MRIVVTLKQVHDPNTPRAALRIGQDGRSLALAMGPGLIMNGYDANALEAALQLREARGGTVTVLSVGADSCKEVLRRGLAMGADAALHVAGPSGLDGDSTMVAACLHSAIHALGASPDLVLSGRSASDTDGGVVPLLLAGMLRIPALTPVRAIQAEETGELLVERVAGDGAQRLRVRGSAVICVSSEINRPRSPALKGVIAAKRASIASHTLGPEQAALLRAGAKLRRLAIPAPTPQLLELIARPTVTEAGAALAERLFKEGLV
jgi:electron transfer flavoprotein beta subunit